MKARSHASNRVHDRVWRTFLTITIAIVGITLSVPTSGKERLALPGYHYHFPVDHGSHDEFRTEWWYYTGHLSSENGRRFGFELTFFRERMNEDLVRDNPSRWAVRHLYLAHAAVTDVESGRFRYAEKVSRAALGKAGADQDRLRVWIDRWFAEAAEDHQSYRLSTSGDDFSFNLTLVPAKPAVVHGIDGVSRKGDERGQASHYYSFTRLRTEGTITLQGKSFAVHGLSWMDHEFGSASLGQDQVGWDWFSLQLQDETELMFYRLRRADGSTDRVSSGTYVGRDGSLRHLQVDHLHIEELSSWNSPASGARYPSRWRLTVPSLSLSLILTPLVADQELITARSTQVTYWEGAVQVTGMKNGAPVAGHGYVELTGYAAPFRGGS